MKASPSTTSFGSLVGKIMASPLGQHQAWALIALAKTCDNQWRSDAPVKRLAALARLGTTVTRDALRDLVEAGVVQREARVSAAHRHWIVLDRINALGENVQGAIPPSARRSPPPPPGGAPPLRPAEPPPPPGGAPPSARRSPRHIRSRARPFF